MRVTSKGAGWALAVLAAGSLGHAQEEPQAVAPQFTQFKFTRERVGHKVLVSAEFTNVTPAPLRKVYVIVVYYDGDRELRRSSVAHVPLIGVGRSAPLKMEARQVERFSKYLVAVTWDGGGRTYDGKDATSMPVARKATPARPAVVSAENFPPASFPGEAGVILKVHNGGEIGAQEPTAIFSFKDAAGRVVHKVRVLLDKESRAGWEDTYEVNIPNVPRYASVDVGVTYLAAEGPSWNEAPPGTKTVEIRKSRLIRLTEGVTRVSGVLTNSLAVPVQNVTLTFQFGGQSFPQLFKGVLPAGKGRPFEVYLPARASFDGASYTLAFETGVDAKAPAAVDPPKPRVGRTESRQVKQVSLVMIPEGKKVVEKQAELKITRPKLYASIPGLSMVDGYYLKNRKYSGDVWLVVMKFVDDKGKPAQPVGTITAVVYDGKKPLRKVQRIIKKQSWRLDVRRLTNFNIRPDVLAYDKQEKELYVALYRSEAPFVNFKADITLTVRNVGVWEWKGLTKESESGLRGPDRPK